MTDGGVDKFCMREGMRDGGGEAIEEAEEEGFMGLGREGAARDEKEEEEEGPIMASEVEDSD